MHNSSGRARRPPRRLTIMPSALPTMKVATRITRRRVNPRSPALMATAIRVVLPLMNETKSPLAMKPMASVMPARTESMATRLRPMRPRHFCVCK
ncbi:hypothetical protein D3C86_1693060 [compost metagenome]